MALALVRSGLALLMMGSGPASPRAPVSTPGTTYPRQAPAGAAHSVTLEASGGGRRGPGRFRQDLGRDRLGRRGRGGNRAHRRKRRHGQRPGHGWVAAGSGQRCPRQPPRARLVGSRRGHARRPAGGGRPACRPRPGRVRPRPSGRPHREPLVTGAIGLSVGAAIGALLPASELERQHLGATGEALRHKASTVLDSGVAAAKDAGGEVYETVRDEADRQGLVPVERRSPRRSTPPVRTAGAAAGEIAEEADGVGLERRLRLRSLQLRQSADLLTQEAAIKRSASDARWSAGAHRGSHRAATAYGGGR